MSTSDLSGKDWWHRNQRKYPNSQSIDDLESGFRTRVEDFIGSLRNGGANVTIASTRRNATRAFLMHYSWKVGHGDTAASDVPKHDGLTIEWDHGDEERSKKAAMEMVKLFNMAFIAALNSNHIAGKAIDMDISWDGTLVLTRPAPLLTRIESLPRTGRGNGELHRIGADTFGVKKLKSDPPHWSYNGR